MSPTARLDAEMLMAHALGVGREALLLGDRRGPPPEGFAALVDRRLAQEPVAYITGERDFWTITLGVTPDVLIPRPDSETLIEAALDHFAGRDAPKHILDLGTGSGALLLAALSEWPEAEGVGVDISPAALAVARGNAESLGLGARASFVEGGWRGDPQADLILCNPPYIGTDEVLPVGVTDYEPAGALWAGADGLDAYRAIAPLLDFAPGGVAVIEIGMGQGESAAALFRDCGFIVAVRCDLEGRNRCLVVTR
ncbi:peptide chain release factor N(5)-glutamine methyltransferase [Sphingomonas sp. AP4-R1]|uniref:peptide chain release factor N(5)-glutamine methyltransferase n=1 Tax=Sphingomonas sp. AP4-R1 TaxID=2735134 RepID=UPI001493564B|nr:peptide chain release factor N(5)-glutamine methyltransferase [Sphingomonas sp. AP4-R1]QJU60415.1 peptide chain release factor N(5)-glutamine methyltransferase [Sphingomonas sp. AP4-R1]